MEIIAVANQKGGCGKTTTAINLSACLGKRKQRILLIDMDPQGHASLGLGLQCEDREGLYEVFLREVTLSEVIIPDVAERVDLVPGTISLAAVEHLLSDTPEREWRLASHLAQLEGKYDYVIIDCPPSLGLLSFNALRAADRVLIPMEMSAFSLDGVERLTETIDLLAEKYQTELPVTMLPTMVDMRPRFSREMMREVNELFPEEMSRATIHYTVRLKEAARKGVPVIELDPECLATSDYDRLAREVMGENVGRVTVTAFQEMVMPKQAEKAIAAGAADVYHEIAEVGSDVPRSMAAGATVGAFAVQEQVASVTDEVEAETSSSMPIYPLGASTDDDEEDEETLSMADDPDGDGMDDEDEDHEEMIAASADDDTEGDEDEDDEETISASGSTGSGDDEDENGEEADDTVYASSDAGVRYASIPADDNPTFSSVGEGALGDWRSAAEGVLAEIKEEEREEEALSAAGDDDEDDEDEETLSAAGDDDEDEETLSAAGDDDEDEETLSATADDDEDADQTVVDEAGFQAAVEAAASTPALVHRSVLEADASGHHEVTLDFDGYSGKRVQVAGDFNGWIPDRGISTRMEHGKLVKVLNLKPGDYQYRVIVDGIWQEDPGNPVQVPNIYGGTNSLLQVNTTEPSRNI